MDSSLMVRQLDYDRKRRERVPFTLAYCDGFDTGSSPVYPILTNIGFASQST